MSRKSEQANMACSHLNIISRCASVYMIDDLIHPLILYV